MRITIAQLNSVVGDISGNTRKIKSVVQKAAEKKSDLVIFPEMFITGYPPRDLLEKQKFISDINNSTSNIIAISEIYPQIGILYGTVISEEESRGRGLYNAALFIYNGKMRGEQYKTLLPTYDVFDEARHFTPSDKINIISFKGEKIGISICEDMWSISDTGIKKQYQTDPIERLAKKNASLLINISASPFHAGKDKIRYQIIHQHCRRHKLPFIYVNAVGGNDELIFDGSSMIVNKDGNVIDILPSFKQKIKTISFNKNRKAKKFVPADEVTSIYNALLLGIKDYVKKCGFKHVVLGLSGGIDSAVTASLAAKALGKDNVLAFFMPSMYSSKQSAVYAAVLAKNLGITLKNVPITKIYYSYINELKKHFKSKKENVTEENIQARIRGNILMAFSNKFGSLVLSSGNKSELAVGYCTLYGDMSGGLGILSDVSKTMVYKLAYYINKKKEIIPSDIISRAPSAELKPNQKDSDTLPAYKILDQILELYIDENYSADEIITKGFDPHTVAWVTNTVNKNEYKRRQATPGLKVTSKAFGIGRRMPIAAKYKI